MTSATQKLNALLLNGEQFFKAANEDFLRQPYLPGKWSRKQILGHLVDSALNNLTRFTEIGYQPQPYAYREYDQAALVAVNDYQHMDTPELVQLWLSLNKQIARVMASASDERLNLKILFPDGSISDLRFIMHDYPQHMEHHLKQIFGNG